MEDLSIFSSQFTSTSMLADLGIKSSVDSHGEDQFTIDIDIDIDFGLGISNSHAVFNKATKRWKLVDSPDSKRIGRSAAPKRASNNGSWTQFLPKSPHRDLFLRKDWGNTPLGPLDTWPAVLQTGCHLIYADSRAATVLWGDDLILVPNAAYLKSVKGRLLKSSDIMGLPLFQVWPELRGDVVPKLTQLAETGEAFTHTKLNVSPVNEDGTVQEETHWQAFFLPLKGESGETFGFYNIAVDVTKQIIQERWISTLNAVSTPPSDQDLSIWEHVFQVLSNNDQDFPLAFAYSASDDPTVGSCELTLQQQYGVPRAGHPLVPVRCDLYEGNSGFTPAYRKARLSNEAVVLRRSDGTLSLDLEGFEWRGSGIPCKSVAVIPIISSESLLGIIVVGLNPRRPLDSDYVAFLHSFSQQMSATITISLDREEANLRAERLKKQLADSERRIRDMAEVGPAGLLTVTVNGVVSWANDQYYKITGHSRDDIFELSFLDVIHPDDLQKAADAWKVLSEQRKSVRDDFRLKRKWQPPPSPGVPNPPEEPVSMLVIAYPVIENDEIVSIAGSVIDISTFKWAELVQSRSASDAKEAKRLQENFIDIVSHEMRNPLSAITQLADGIATSLDDVQSGDAKAVRTALEANVESAATILLCAAHQKRIIDDVLTLSKLDSMMLSITPVVVQPKAVVTSVLKMFEAEFQTNSISVDWALEESYVSHNIDWVTLDPSRLTQIFINLITNALKFTRLEPVREIRIKAGASLTKPPYTPGIQWFPTKQGRRDLTDGPEWGTGEPVYLLFEVVDTGKGLKQEEMTRLFERFQQATAKTHIKYGGSGLGLFISRELTETQGGEIGVMSKPGEGSTFAFYVKGRRASAPQEPAKVLITEPSTLNRHIPKREPEPILESGSPGPPARLRLLLVEDNVVNAKVLTRQLEKAGCEVFLANHGLECLDWLQKSRSWRELEHEESCVDFDCILMDVEMPVMDGLTATRRIRQMEEEGLLTRHLSIVAITANAREEQIQQTLKAGADAVQPKPFRVKELLLKINEMIKQTTR